MCNHGTATHWIIVKIVCTAVICSQMYACSNSDAEAEALEPEIDPRYQTADALLEYYNSLATTEPFAIRRTLDLFYAENRTQETYIEIARKMADFAELDYEVYQRFGESMNPRQAEDHLLMASEAARMTRRDNQRAEATYTNNEGNEETIYFVQIGQRWHISGYTVEYNFDWEESIGDVTAIAELADDVSKAARKVLPAVRSGEIQSLDEARDAYAQAIVAGLMPPD